MDQSSAAKIAAIVLAAGSSRRFGPQNKLLVDVGGEPLVRRVAGRVAASGLAPVIVVTGHDRARIEAALDGLDVVLVHNSRHLQGMGHTVAAGVAMLDDDARAVLITPGDLPDLAPALIKRLVGVFEAAGGERIVFPALASGAQRNPVLWPRRFFPELARLTGDKGGRDLIKANADATLPVEIASDAPFSDVDRPEDLERWRRGQARE
jgi:molybdenum cofactor cytidylyltransferase